MHENDIGFFDFEDRFQGGDHPAGQTGEGLVRTHQVEVMIGANLKRRQDLIQHAAVLGGDADAHGKFAGKAGEMPDDRAELDRFRPGSKDEKGFQRLTPLGARI